VLTLTENDFQEAFQKWRWRWDRCLHEGGNYFEGDGGRYALCSVLWFLQRHSWVFLIPPRICILIESSGYRKLLCFFLRLSTVNAETTPRRKVGT
jgi:hypothetical protein